MQYTLVESQNVFQEAIRKLKLADLLYLDLEFDKNHFRYGFNLCLVQISDGKECFIIDPLSEINIAKIFPILESPNKEIITFAFSEDIRLLHHLGCFPTRIIDLAIVLRLLNEPSLSLENVLFQKLSIPPKKSQQKSNWFDRPLTEEQLVYAADDVTHLPKLNDLLRAEIKSQHKENWLEDEIQFLREQDWSQEEQQAAIPTKNIKYFGLQEWMRYTALFEYREKKAKEINRPSYKVIDKLFLEKLAKLEAEPKNIIDEKRVYPSLKNSGVIDELKELLAQVENEIKRKEIQPNQPARAALNPTEKLELRQRRSWMDTAKNTIFFPIQTYLNENYGEFFTNYILSKRRIDGILNKQSILLPYQKKLIIEAAVNLNIKSIEEYI